MLPTVGKIKVDKHRTCCVTWGTQCGSNDKREYNRVVEFKSVICFSQCYQPEENKNRQTHSVTCGKPTGVVEGVK